MLCISRDTADQTFGHGGWLKLRHKDTMLAAPSQPVVQSQQTPRQNRLFTEGLIRVLDETGDHPSPRLFIERGRTDRNGPPFWKLRGVGSRIGAHAAAPSRIIQGWRLICRRGPSGFPAGTRKAQNGLQADPTLG